MVGNGLVTHQGYTICGAASDSLVMVLMISGLITFIVFVVGFKYDTEDDAPEHGFLRRKPLTLPSFVFVISLILVIAIAPHPMAQYYGPNETQMHFLESDTTNFRVYDGIAYSYIIEIYVSFFIEPDESLIVQADIYQDDTLIDSGMLEINGTILDPWVSGELSTAVPAGLYEVRISYSQYDNGALKPVSRWATVIISQPLVSGFFTEVMTWQSYAFLLIAGSFLFILAGCCVGREDKKRIRQEPYDQEPPREGEIYIRRA